MTTQGLLATRVRRTTGLRHIPFRFLMFTNLGRKDKGYQKYFLYFCRKITQTDDITNSS